MAFVCGVGVSTVLAARRRADEARQTGARVVTPARAAGRPPHLPKDKDVVHDGGELHPEGQSGCRCETAGMFAVKLAAKLPVECAAEFVWPQNATKQTLPQTSPGISTPTSNFALPARRPRGILLIERAGVRGQFVRAAAQNPEDRRGLSLLRIVVLAW